MNFEKSIDTSRIITIGESCVGKTSILERLSKGSFNINEKSTVGAMFIQHIENIEGVSIELQVWDTAGQERFRSLGPIYYRNSSAGIFVFDMTQQYTFTKLNLWLKSFIDTAGTDALIFIVGNKIDLSGHEVEVPYVQQWCKEQGYFFYTTSAKTGEGIKELFHQISIELIKKKNKNFETKIINNLNKIEKNENKKKNCC